VVLGNAPVNTGTGESFVEGLADEYSAEMTRMMTAEFSGMSVSGSGEKIRARYGFERHCSCGGRPQYSGRILRGCVQSRRRIRNVRGNSRCQVLRALFAGGRGFDTELGYNGRGQFLFALLGEQPSEEGIRLANNHSSVNAKPRTGPTLYNITIVGAGENGQGEDNTLILVEDGPEDTSGT